MKRFGKSLSLVVVLIMTLSFITDCHRSSDSPLPSTDPCAGKSITGAQFNIYEDAHGTFPGLPTSFWSKYSSDTVTNAMKVINFEALDKDGLNYSWTIGANTYTTSKVTLDFSSRPTAQTVIPISLIIKKKHIDSCFPSDTGTMTLSKLLVISDTSIVSGNFRGIRTDTLGEHPSDSFTVYLNPIYPLIQYDGSHHPIDTIKTLVVQNLYLGCSNNSPYPLLAVGYKELYFGGGPNNCSNVGGKAILGPSNNLITIRYSYFNSQTQSFEDYKFKGIRIK